MLWESYYYFYAQAQTHWIMPWEVFMNCYAEANNKFKKSSSIWEETIKLLLERKKLTNKKKTLVYNMKKANEIRKDINKLKEQTKKKEDEMPNVLNSVVDD